MESARDYHLPAKCVLRAHYASDACTYNVNYAPLMNIATIQCWASLANNFCPGRVFASPTCTYTHRGKHVTSFSLFKENVRPEWEDPQNKCGCTCSLRAAMDAQSIDDLWRDLSIELLRGGFCESIVGIQLTKKTMRRHNVVVKFDVWVTASGEASKLVEQLDRMHVFHPGFIILKRQ